MSPTTGRRSAWTRAAVLVVAAVAAVAVLTPAPWWDQATRGVLSVARLADGTGPPPAGPSGPVQVGGYVPTPEERRAAQESSRDAWSSRDPVLVPTGRATTSP